MSNQLPVVPTDPARKVSRRELAQTLLSGLAGALLPGVSPLHPVYGHLLNGALLDSAEDVLAAGTQKTAFLSAPQFLSLQKIAEALVPGSGKAQSAAFIDLLLRVDSGRSQQDFAASLAAFEAAAESKLQKKMAALSEDQLNDLLQGACVKDSENYAHFENLKGWVVGAYYSSEIGMRELGWTPDRVFAAYPVCTHAESHS